MGWGPCGAGGPFVTVICPAAKITNTFLSEGLAAIGLRALMLPSCGHTGRGLGWGKVQRGDVGGPQMDGQREGCLLTLRCPPRLPWRLSQS